MDCESNRKSGVMNQLLVDAKGNDPTYRIIGAEMTVHNHLGSGYKEEVYERVLGEELGKREIETVRQFPVHVDNEGATVATFYLDLYVENQVVFEVKAINHQLTSDEFAQVLNYLKATSAPVGWLSNFGRRRLDYKRIFPAIWEGKSIQRIGRDNAIKSNIDSE